MANLLDHYEEEPATPSSRPSIQACKSITRSQDVTESSNDRKKELEMSMLWTVSGKSDRTHLAPNPCISFPGGTVDRRSNKRVLCGRVQISGFNQKPTTSPYQTHQFALTTILKSGSNNNECCQCCHACSSQKYRVPGFGEQSFVEIPPSSHRSAPHSSPNPQLPSAMQKEAK